MQKPKPTAGLRHVALYSSNLEACVHFYSELIGMDIVWQPDPDNYYLSSGTDNLALHRAAPDFVAGENQRLDHIGFFLTNKTDVDDWYEFLKANKVRIIKEPKDHRDGTRSCYVADPDGNIVQMIYYPL